MTLIVHTARVTYSGPDRLDITRKSGDRDGIAFAPSWGLLRPMLEVRRRGESIESLWPSYVAGYRNEMRGSFLQCPDDWRALLARAEVTLVCYCTDPARCHRTLLAGFLGKLGADVRGERDLGDRP